jgi:hypothetical protein
LCILFACRNGANCHIEARFWCGRKSDWDFFVDLPKARVILPLMAPGYRAVAEENLRANRFAGVCFTLPPACGTSLIGHADDRFGGMTPRVSGVFQ